MDEDCMGEDYTNEDSMDEGDSDFDEDLIVD